MPENRTKTGQFCPGSSGNPGGRPKHTPEQRDALDAIKSLAPEAVETMARLLKAKDTPSALKVRIAEIVLDRTYGKPRQEVKMQSTVLSAEAKAELDKLLEETKGEIR